MLTKADKKPAKAAPKRLRRTRRATCRASAMTSKPSRCPARCRRGRTPRRNATTASMPSSFPARPSPRRAAPTSAPGSTASARACATRGRFTNAKLSRCGRSAPCLDDHSLPLGQLRWRPDPGAEAEAQFPRRHPHHDDGRRRADADRHGGARLRLQRGHGRRLFLQCRWRTADRAAGRHASASSPKWASWMSSRWRSASCRAA